MKNEKIRHIALVAIFGAVAFVLMFFSFNIPFLSPFAEIDLSAVMELMGGFLLGPLGGAEIIVLKVVLKLLFKGSSSMLTGEVQNILLKWLLLFQQRFFIKNIRLKKVQY